MIDRKSIELEKSDKDLEKNVNPNMFQLFKNPSSSDFLDILKNHLVRAPDEKKVENILIRDLNYFLNVKIDEVVFPLYTVKGQTILQLVHGAGDIEMRDRILKPCFDKLYGSKEKGKEEMWKQMSELKNIHKQFDFGPIIQAISNETFHFVERETRKFVLSPATIAAIRKFRKEYDASQPKIIEKGMHFRWEVLQELSVVYAAAAAQWETRQDNYYLRCALLEDVVFAWVLRYTTKNDQQRFNQGLYYLLMKDPDPFMRMQKTRDKCDFEEVLNTQSDDFILDTSCVNILYGLSGLARDRWLGATMRLMVVDSCKTFVEQKCFARLAYTDENLRAYSCFM